MSTSGSKINWQKLSPWLYTAGLFLIWELSCWLFSIPVYFLPPPTVILHAFQEFQTALWENSIQTLWTTIVQMKRAPVTHAEISLTHIETSFGVNL